VTASAPTIVATCAGLDAGTWTDAVHGPILRHAIALADLSGRAPRLLHLNTAGGDPRAAEGAEIEAGRLAGVEASHLRLFPHPNVPSIDEAVLGADVVWVSGGSLVNLLALWRAHGVDRAMRRAWEAGVVLAGGSAGAMCWFSGAVSKSFGPEPSVVADGLGFLPFSLSAHDDSEPERGAVYRAAVAAGELPPGWALSEGTGLVFRGTDLVDVLTERGGAVTRVDRDGVDEVSSRRPPG
jgi:peptidase E